MSPLDTRNFVEDQAVTRRPKGLRAASAASTVRVGMRIGRWRLMCESYTTGGASSPLKAACSQSVTLALLRSPHPSRSIGLAFWCQVGPAPGAEHPFSTSVDDAAGLASWPLRWRQPPGFALAIPTSSIGGCAVRHWMRCNGMSCRDGLPAGRGGHAPAGPIR